MNTEFHDRVAGTDCKIGFELYGQIFQIVDAVPEHVAFVTNAALLQLAAQHWPKVTDICSLYGFRLLLKKKKKKNAEYKKVVGESPE